MRARPPAWLEGADAARGLPKLQDSGALVRRQQQTPPGFVFARGTPRPAGSSQTGVASQCHAPPRHRGATRQVSGAGPRLWGAGRRAMGCNADHPTERESCRGLPTVGELAQGHQVLPERALKKIILMFSCLRYTICLFHNRIPQPELAQRVGSGHGKWPGSAGKRGWKGSALVLGPGVTPAGSSLTHTFAQNPKLRLKPAQERHRLRTRGVHATARRPPRDRSAQQAQPQTDPIHSPTEAPQGEKAQTFCLRESHHPSKTPFYP